MTTRNEKILSCINPATQVGIEIGPLMSPVVTREMGAVRYVDHETTEGLRAKYAHDPNVDISKIVDVDYAWGSQTLPELVEKEIPFDYVIASHVIEHVPDFIGWLKEIKSVLKPGGILSLAIPNKQFCFDYYRQVTKPADVIEAFLRRSRKPSPRQIFDYIASAVSRNGAISWSEIARENELLPMFSEPRAWEAASQAFENDTYCDAHCWVFTPYSLFRLLETLINLDLFDFQVADFHETEGCEFYISLQTVEVEKSLSDRQQIQLASLSKIKAGRSPEQVEIELEQKNQLAQANTQFQQLQEQYQQNQAEMEKLRSRVKRLRTELQNTQAEIEAMKTSKFWTLRSQWFKLKSLLKV